MIARMIEIGMCCGMEMNVKKKKSQTKISNEPPLGTDYDRSKTGVCGIFQLFG